MKKIILAFIAGVFLIFGALEVNGIINITGTIADEQMNRNHEKIVGQVRTALLNREENVKIKYIGKKENVQEYAKEIIRDAFEIDDEEIIYDYDYLRFVYRGFTAYISGFGVFFTIRYDFQYSESAGETKWVCERAKEIISDLKLDKKSQYEKIKLIHDYIIENISYDLTVKNNTAYEALMTNATACQGYSNLCYILLTEAGVKSRIITGTGHGELHAWNIVEIDGLWYNLDCTWDDPVGGGINKQSHKYFLKSNEHFKDHTRDEEYETEYFNLIFKMSQEDYMKK